MARPKSKGAYVPLAAQYYNDDAILEAGPDAELLFLRILAFLASVPTDGFLTERQVKVAGSGLRNVARRLQDLERTGLLVAQDGGFVARSWTKWNKTAEQIGKELARDRERKARDSAARQDNSDRNPDGIQPDSALQSRAEQSSTEQRKNVAEIRPDVSRLCDLLADLIEANGSKRPDITKRWHDAARLMLDNDKRPLGEALGLIQWSQKHEFWRANILSMPTFRDKYDRLRLQRTGGPEPEPKLRKVVSGRAD